MIDLGDFGMTLKASEAETAGVVSVLDAIGGGPAMEIVGPPPERSL
jgi:hypothetical protein